MSDSYQAIYDAVRSRIFNGDVGAAISDVARSAFDISILIPLAQEAIGSISYEMTRPSVVYRPRLAKDGNMWIACYGDDLQEGCVGCGETPERAMEAFDKAWRLNGGSV